MATTRTVASLKRKRHRTPRQRSLPDTARWRRLRRMVLDEEPLCKHCLGRGLIVSATVVDHIRPIRQGGEAFDRDNLQGLCKRCHDRKTAKESGLGR